ncbi:MAG: cupredoxin domain-containing protein [Chloroflexi bacterium]|nr:cupredoxin domain-containing protein [Chloroflexota bacterium]
MRYVVAIVASAAVVTAACGASASTPRADEGRRIEVSMKEFAFTPVMLSLKAGEKVTLAFKQAGTVEHEFMAGRDPTKDMGYMKDLFAGLEHEITPTPASGHGMGHGAERVGVRVPPGRTATLTFVVPSKPGTYEFGCFVAGHYEAGMKGTLSIQ